MVNPAVAEQHQWTSHSLTTRWNFTKDTRELMFDTSYAGLMPLMNRGRTTVLDLFGRKFTQFEIFTTQNNHGRLNLRKHLPFSIGQKL